MTTGCRVFALLLDLFEETAQISVKYQQMNQISSCFAALLMIREHGIIFGGSLWHIAGGNTPSGSTGVV
jgi:hypothetical protein